MRNRGQSEIGLAYLNTGYCTDIKSLGGFLWTHFHHVLSKRDDRIAGREDLSIPSNFAQQTQAEILILAEILGEEQRERVKEVLQAKGYGHFHHGQGQPLAGHDEGVIGARDYSHYFDETLIASKIPFRQLELEVIGKNETGQHGNGGGLAAIHLPDYNCNLFAGHFPLRPRSFNEQASIITGARARYSGLIEHGGHEIVLGDFNLTPQDLERDHASLLRGLHLLTPDAPTCSTVIPLHLFFRKCLDHAWGSEGVRVLNAATILTQSDHRGIRVKLKLKPA